MGRPAFFSNRAIEERVAILEPLMGPSTPLRLRSKFRLVAQTARERIKLEPRLLCS